MSHLLIDRFRFDSFSITEDGEAGTRLLTRFGKTVFLFFMVTPPEATVERAWHRGIQTGRYKAVDDLLFHNVEAYTGMPELFFSWIQSRNKHIHFEFLDNSVALGQRPVTIASGWNRTMHIYDVQAMQNIDRFRKIHTAAKSADNVYKSNAESDNWDFLKQCAHHLEQMLFLNPQTSRCYAEIRDGRWVSLAIDEAPVAFNPRKITPLGISEISGTQESIPLHVAPPSLSDVVCEVGADNAVSVQ
jgi:hypothetical protein